MMPYTPRLKPFAGKREEIIPIFPKTDFLIKSFCPICLHQPFGALAGFPAPAYQLSADSLPLECRQDSQVINDRAKMQVAESPDASYQSAIGLGGDDKCGMEKSNIEMVHHILYGGVLRSPAYRQEQAVQLVTGQVFPCSVFYTDNH